MWNHKNRKNQIRARHTVWIQYSMRTECWKTVEPLCYFQFYCCSSVHSHFYNNNRATFWSAPKHKCVFRILITGMLHGRLLNSLIFATDQKCCFEYITYVKMTSHQPNIHTTNSIQNFVLCFCDPRIKRNSHLIFYPFFLCHY